MSSESLLIVGDFNIHVDIPRDPNAIRFLDLLSSMRLDQHVDKPTHTSINQSINQYFISTWKFTYNFSSLNMT